MSESDPAASLLTLPYELVELILGSGPVSLSLGLTTSPLLPEAAGWNEPEFGTGLDTPSPRALSETCKILRAIALPLLWSSIRVDSIAQLGRLRESIRVSAHLAQHVRSFTFAWTLAADKHAIRYINEEYQENAESLSLLELAFRNRSQMFASLAHSYGKELKRIVEREARNGSLHSKEYFDHPRYGGIHDLDEPLLLDDADPSLVESYDWTAPRGIGPDGRGEDRHIKTSEQLTDCITEVVDQFKVLESFRWLSNVFAMPSGVFNALRRLATPLKVLSPGLALGKNIVNSLPFWELVRKLQSLELTLDPLGTLDSELQNFEEQDEATYLSFELPDKVPTEGHDITALHCQIARRTIIEAAKGGQLRVIFTHERVLGEPFAIRSLLPYWVSIRTDWYSARIGPSWFAAATEFRLLLSHASRWLDGKPWKLEPEQLGELTTQDVQALRGYFEENGMPHRWYIKTERELKLARRLTSYLLWLEEDKELAERVAVAWNQLVRRGEKVLCWCEKCRPFWKEESQEWEKRV